MMENVAGAPSVGMGPSGAMGIIQTGIGAMQASEALQHAENLPDYKKISVSPELRLAYNLSRRNAVDGWSPEERTNFEGMLSRQGSEAINLFRNAGFAGLGSAAAGIMGGDALNQFAAQGAVNKRAGLGQFANISGQIQGVNDAEVNRFNTQLNLEAEKLGEAAEAGMGNMFGGLNSFGTSLQNEQAMDSLGGVT